MRRPGQLIILILILLAFPLFAIASNDDYYELRGRLLQPNGYPFRNFTPIVFLQGATNPFTAEAWVNAAGDFTFKKLAAGMYVLNVSIPHHGEMRRSIDIGPSLADQKGRVEMTFRFEPNTTLGSRTVSVTQLAVSDSARKEYARALDHLSKHDIPGAVERLEKAVEIAPQFAEAWNRLGTIAYQGGNYEQAESHFREALKHDPQSYSPLVNLGGALLSQRKYQEALPINVRAGRAQPNDPLAHTQLGRTYLMLGQHVLAEQHLQRTKKLDPRHFSLPQLTLAEIYRVRGDRTNLIRELEEFLRLHPDSEFAPRALRTLEKARTQARQE